MSHERNMKWLNDRRIIYRRDPITDKPTESTDQYDYYAEGTYQCYSLFRSKAKITTYKSLKWHFLVLYYLNYEGVEGDEISLEDDMRTVFKFIANKENGFVTFFIKQKILNSMINEVFGAGDTPPRNRIRKVIFKDYTGLSLSEKLSIVGRLIGRSKRRKARNYLNIKKPFPNKITKICLNYELAQFFYKNKSFSDKGDYKKDIINAYEELWTEILIPTELLKNKINSIIKDTKKIVGIQIRCGDLGMITNKGEKESYNNHYPETIKNIKEYLESIKNHIKLEDYNIFITSDSDIAIDKAKEVWDEDKILYNYDLIQHIDRKAVNNDISKVFVDSYILSQKSDILYISEYSNFGRIAVLSCGHELIYNLKCEKLKKINMVSKKIKLFS